MQGDVGTTRTLESAWRNAGARRNNFDLIRFVAAAMVILSHSFDITKGRGAFEPLRWATGGETSLGHAAVLIFFIVSGFLIVKSWKRAPSVYSFSVKRGLRIFPGLIAVVLITIFLLGPALSSHGAAAYFADPETWSYLANIGLYTKYNQLPGVFETLPLSGYANGPLWTLKFEMICYVSVAVLGVFRLLSVRMVGALFLVTTAAAIAAGDKTFGGVNYYLFQSADLGRAFFVGAIAALAGAHIPLTKNIAVLCGVVLILAMPLGLFDEVFPLAGGYLTFYAAFAKLPFAGSFMGGEDYSYGLYVWGFPMQQITMLMTGWTFWLANFLIAFPLALGCAFLSWRLIEAPCLRQKSAFLNWAPRRNPFINQH